jgi:hypothetical protein
VRERSQIAGTVSKFEQTAIWRRVKVNSYISC